LVETDAAALNERDAQSHEGISVRAIHVEVVNQLLG
jgi:hypothetical protein